MLNTIITALFDVLKLIIFLNQYIVFRIEGYKKATKNHVT